MKRLISILGLIIFIVSFSLAQSNVKIIVLPQHEENFNKTISWLKKDESFKNKVDLIKSFEEAFKYAKAGDYVNYIHWVHVFGSELSKLTESEKSKFENFLSKLPIPEVKEYKIEKGPSCTVSCTFGSCAAIECTRGASCRCIGGYPVCDCF